MQIQTDTEMHDAEAVITAGYLELDTGKKVSEFILQIMSQLICYHFQRHPNVLSFRKLIASFFHVAPCVLCFCT